MRALRKAGAALLVLAAFPVLALSATAADSVSPYIDQLKAGFKDKDTGYDDTDRTTQNPDPYIQSQKKKIDEGGPQTQAAPVGGGNQPYIDSLKAKNPAELGPSTEPTTSYTEEQKAKLGPTDDEGAIEKLAAGASTLHMKRPGPVRGSVGLKIGTVVDHAFTGSAPVVTADFSSIYGSGWVPDITLMAEYKIFYGDTFGGLGILGSAGVGIFKGTGVFAIQLNQPDGQTPFPSQSQTHTTFIAIPATIALKYQTNLTGRYIHPYLMGGPTAIGMTEARNDGIQGHKALSTGLTTTAGIAFLLDWVTKSDTWDLYQDFSIKHYYFSIEYTKLTTFSSAVAVSYSGVDAGFNFDF